MRVEDEDPFSSPACGLAGAHCQPLTRKRA